VTNPAPSHYAPAYPADESPLPRSGVLVLRNAVADYFSDRNVPALVAEVGLKYRSFLLNQAPDCANRVVFIPGEFTGENAPKPRPYGKLSRETMNSASVVNPRELLAWDRPLTVSIWAAPVPGAVDKIGVATAVAEDLLEQVVRAVTYASDGKGNSLAASVEWGEVTITNPPEENSFGVELLVSLIQKGPLFDETLETVQAEPALSEDFR